MGQQASKALLQQGQVLKEETLQENYFFRQIYIKEKYFIKCYLEKLKKYYIKLYNSNKPFKSESLKNNLFIDDVYNKIENVMGMQESNINNDNSISSISYSEQLKQGINSKNIKLFKFFYGKHQKYKPTLDQKKEQHYKDILIATNLIDESFQLTKKNTLLEIKQQIISKQFQQFLLFQGQPDLIIRQKKLKHLLLSYLALPFRLVLSTFAIIIFTPISFVVNATNFIIEDENYQERQKQQKYSKVRLSVNQSSFLSYLICCNKKRERNFDKYFNFSSLQSPVQFLDFVKFWVFSGILVAYFLMKKLLPDNNAQDENMRLIVYFVIIKEILFLLLEILSKYSNTNTDFDTSLQDKQQILERLQISDEDLQVEFMRMPVEVELVLQLEFYYLKDIEYVLKNENDQTENGQDNYETLINRINIVKHLIIQKRQIFNGMSLFYQYLFTPEENGLSEQTIGVDKDYLKLYEKRQEDSKKKIFQIGFGFITKGLINKFFAILKFFCLIFMIITFVLVIFQYLNFQIKNEQAFNYMKRYCTIIFVILFDFECNSIQLLKSYRNSLKRLTSLLIYDRSEENKSNYDINSYELPCINLFSLKSINTWYNMRKLTFQQNVANKNIIMLHCLLEFTVTITLVILFWPTLYSFYTVQTECEGQSISSTNLIVLLILFYRIIIKSLFEIVSFFCEINSSYYEHQQILQDITSALKQTLDKYSQLSNKEYQNEKDQNHPIIFFFQQEAIKQIKRILKYQEHSNVLDQLEYMVIDMRVENKISSSRNINQYLKELDLKVNNNYETMKYENIKSYIDGLASKISELGQYSNISQMQLSQKEQKHKEQKYLKQLIKQYEAIIKDLEEHQKENQLYFLNIIPINKDQLSGFFWIFVPLLLSVLLKVFKKGDFSFIKDIVDEIWNNLR
ncbi:hypothetical protein ABPG72_006314 [Tetrahymena utriculariae]